MKNRDAEFVEKVFNDARRENLLKVKRGLRLGFLVAYIIGSFLLFYIIFSSDFHIIPIIGWMFFTLMVLAGLIQFDYEIKMILLVKRFKEHYAPSTDEMELPTITMPCKSSTEDKI